MFKKRFDVFGVTFSFSFYLVVALQACFFINQSIASGTPAKHLSKIKHTVEHSSSLDLWSYNKKDLHPDPALA